MKNLKSEISEENIDVWIVEDNMRYRNSMTSLINQSAGMTCTHAYATCEEAISQLEDEVHPHIILLDIGLPGMSGIQGIERFKEISPDVQILIITVYDDNEKVFSALCAGASGYLLKDTSPAKIVESIKEVLAGGAPMNMQIAHKVLEIFRKFKPREADYGITDREKDILRLLVEGLTKQQIADKLILSFHTVNTHIKNIYNKLHVNTRSGAVSKIYTENLLNRRI